MHRRTLVASFGLALISASFYCAAAASHCDPDSVGTSHQLAPAGDRVTVQADASSTSGNASASVTTTTSIGLAVEPHAVKSSSKPAVVATSDHADPSVAGGGSSGSTGSDDANGDGGAAPNVHRRGLRWQSFLPGVIK